MKKYVVLCMAVMALMMASCKNEDISISREVKFEVNPYEVVSGFVPYEENAGELASLPLSGEKLRVRIMVYDKQGILLDSDEKELPDYNSTMNTSFELADGNYTIVSTTTVVKSDGKEYWNFEKMERLSEFQIIDDGKIGYEDKILGIGHKSITVSSGNVSFNIPMQPAGALIESTVVDFSDWSGMISRYWLMTKKTSSNCTFNLDGSFNTFYEDGTSYSYIQNYINQTAGWGIYGYTFALPLGRCDFRWEISWLDESDDTPLDDMTLEIKQGKMYLFELNMRDLVYYYGEMGSKSIPSYGKDQSLMKVYHSDSGNTRVAN